MKTSTLVPCLENKLLTRLSDSSSCIDDYDFLRFALELDKSTLIKGMGLLVSVTLTEALFESFYSSSKLRSEFFLSVNYFTFDWTTRVLLLNRRRSAVPSSSESISESVAKLLSCSLESSPILLNISLSLTDFLLEGLDD